MAAYYTGILSDQEMSEVQIRVGDLELLISRVLQMRPYWNVIETYEEFQIDESFKVKLGTLFNILKQDEFLQSVPKVLDFKSWVDLIYIIKASAYLYATRKLSSQTIANAIFTFKVIERESEDYMFNANCETVQKALRYLNLSCSDVVIKKFIRTAKKSGDFPSFRMGDFLFLVSNTKTKWDKLTKFENNVRNLERYGQAQIFPIDPSTLLFPSPNSRLIEYLDKKDRQRPIRFHGFSNLKKKQMRLNRKHKSISVRKRKLNDVKKYLRNPTLRADIYSAISSSSQIVMRSKIDNMRTSYVCSERSTLSSTGNVFQMVGAILQNSEYTPKGHRPHKARHASLSSSFF